MRIFVVGRGHMGGGLADRWERAGHEVTRVGREGGDASPAEAVLIAVPGPAVASALDVVSGLEGKTVIDATNLVDAAPPDGYRSNAEFVKSRTGGPTAKAFNINFAALLDRLDAARARPGNLWSGDDEARATVERLSEDAGYEAIRVGALDSAGPQEAALGLWFAINRAGLGQFVYRMAAPEEL